MNVIEVARSYILLLLVATFITAGVAKFANRRRFASTLATFSFLPLWSLRPIGAGVPLIEIVVGGFLLSSWRWTNLVGSAAALAILFLFLSLSIWVVMRGVADADCSCFGPLAPGTFGWGVAIRNTVLTSLAALTVFWSGTEAKRALYDSDQEAVAFSGLLVLVTVIIYVIGTSIWANRTMFRMSSEQRRSAR